VLLTEFVIKFY